MTASNENALTTGLTGLQIAVVAKDDATVERYQRALERAGAIVRGATDVELPAVLSAAELDAALVDVGDAPEDFAFLRAPGLREALRARRVPLVLLADPALSLSRLAICTDAGVLSPSNEPDRVVTTLADLLAARTISLVPPPVQMAGPLSSSAPSVRIERAPTGRSKVRKLEDERRTFAHDARVLCSIILGFAANLRDEVAGPLAPMQREHVEHILDVLSDVFAMLERYGEPVSARGTSSVSLAPPSSGSSRTLLDDELRLKRREELDVGRLVRQTAALFETFASEREITLDVQLVGSAKAVIDEVQLKQLTTNLLVNAIKFTPRGGRVTLAVRARPDAIDPGVEILVQDTGPGIAPEDRLRVFERGVRLARDSKIPGSGFGLAVVRDVVFDHEGTVDIEDAPDGSGGAAFVVRLPERARTGRELDKSVVDKSTLASRS